MSQDQLQSEIIARSNTKTWNEAREEWSLKTIWMSEDPQTCLCGHHPIKEICVIKNNDNGHETEVGNCCVNNFLGLESEALFVSVRKVKVDAGASFNEVAIRRAHIEGIINEWERKFYLDIWRKRVLSAKQRETKERINSKIMRRWSR